METLSKELIGKYVEQFDNQEKTKEDVLRICFGRKDSFDDVLIQAFMLNSLYGTCIEPKDLRQIAEYVHDKNVIKQILYLVDADVESKSSIVEKIAGVGDRHTVSFASKYCSWICEANCKEKRNTYPIFDRYSRGMIWNINNELFDIKDTKSSYHDYTCFFKAC